ncbi:hypothetical protein IW261DRAFT_253461 [Armillaria novae-zelandiae]|uniref:DNA2/NAM7 helicase helicase domain-containing protein n=1 Tax=Armillaria novae-zelandiae TaxID=153914 RepID=A0AA39P5C3_9AGAR|nr:hypothetical protein IW261DRAFT_253461 [Armillaria novae-zelandiae]
MSKPCLHDVPRRAIRVSIIAPKSGAALAILRKSDFDATLVDEASQITGPCALLLLVKRTQRAILVCDHVRLRPTVKKLGGSLGSHRDTLPVVWASMSEHLYTNHLHSLLYRGGHGRSFQE